MSLVLQLMLNQYTTLAPARGQPNKDKKLTQNQTVIDVEGSTHMRNAGTRMLSAMHAKSLIARTCRTNPDYGKKKDRQPQKTWQKPREKEYTKQTITFQKAQSHTSTVFGQFS